MSRRRFASLMNYVKLDEKTGCWNWQRSRRSGRYGHVQWNGKVTAAHRVFAYMFLGFPLDSRFVLHKCDNGLCCNPKHLFLGTQFDNMRDCADKKRNNQTKKTHCKYGHPFSGDNLYLWSGDRKRRCRACINRKARDYRKRRIAVPRPES